MMAFILVILSQAAHGAEASSEGYQKVVLASEILAKIASGLPIEYDHVILKGDLDLSHSFWPKNSTHISSSIRINDSTIDGNVHFINLIFSEPVSFEGSKFKGLAYFVNSQFKRDASFKRAQFDEFATFSGSQFRNANFANSQFGLADFTDSQFSEDANFKETKFNGDASFSRSQFKRAVNFVDSYFSQNADFKSSQFIGERTAFVGSLFSRDASFRDAHFGYYVNFYNTQFKGDADFKGSQFDGYVVFTGSRFSGDANFGGSQIIQDILIEESQFNRSADFRGFRVMGNAIFDGSQFNGYFLGWASIKNSRFDEATYLALIKTLKDHGQFEDANDCYYTYRLNNMKDFYDYFAWLSCGFGVSWVQTIYFGIFWIIFFGFIYFLMIWRSDSIQIDSKQLLAKSFWFSAIVLLSVPSELYPKRIDTYKDYTFRIKYHLPILERLIGWGFLVLFINTLSRVMIRY